MVVTEAMEVLNQTKDSQLLLPKDKVPMATEEDFRLLPNGSGGGPVLNGDQTNLAGAGGAFLNGDGERPKLARARSSDTDIPLMDDPDTNDNKFDMKDKNGKTDGVSITMPDGTDGYNDNIPDDSEHDTDVLGLRFGDPDQPDGAHPPDDTADALTEAEEDKKSDFNNVKHLTQGMMDVALLSANANQLRTVLESSTAHPYYISSIVLISASLICQVAVGIALIMDYQYHMTNQPQKARNVSRFSMLGIFLIIIINVFIAAFSVATPVSYRPPPTTT